MAGAEIHVDIREAGRRIEGGQQTFTQIFRESQQPLVTGELVTGKQSAEQPDRDFEILHVDVALEREIVRDEFARFCLLLCRASSKGECRERRLVS